MQGECKQIGATRVLGQYTHERDVRWKQDGGERLVKEMKLELGLKRCDRAERNPEKDRVHWCRSFQLRKNTMRLGSMEEPS